MDKPLSDAELKAVRARAKDAELGALGAMFTVAREDVPRLIAELTAWRKAGREVASIILGGDMDRDWPDEVMSITPIKASTVRAIRTLLPPEEPKP